MENPVEVTGVDGVVVVEGGFGVFGAWFHVSCSRGKGVVAAVFGVGLHVILRGFVGRVCVVRLCVAAGIYFVGGGGGSVAVLSMREFVQGVELLVRCLATARGV
ncbi:hypothetical protein Droror1_Dr00027390, partial [Drosera rotundifolia]